MTNIPRPEYPRPQLVRDRWLCLNGPWQFELDHGVSGAERGWQSGREFTAEILVPFCPESKLSGVGNRDFMDCVWYRRIVRIPDAWQGGRVHLHIGACDYETHVYINGREAAWHRGGYTPISADITDLLRGTEAEIVIEAHDDVRSGRQPAGKQSSRYESHGCHYTRTTGIWQTVWLEPVPEVHVQRLHAHVSPRDGSGHLTVTPGGARRPFTVSGRILADGEEVAAFSASSPGCTPAVAALALPKPRRWHVGDPFLYDVELNLVSSAGTDHVRGYFGVREIGVDRRRLTLNGKPLFMRTVLDQGFYPDGICTAPSDEALKADIELSQRMGFDGARLHQKVFEPRLLYWADRLGYYVWGEYASWGANLNDPAACERLLSEWQEVLLRDRGHPSIIGWCPLNETRHGWNEHAVWLHRALYAVTRGIDPSRLAIDASGYVHHAYAGTDLYDVHDYAGPEELAEHLAPLAEGRWAEVPHFSGDAVGYDGALPYFVSECGGIWWNPKQADEKAWGYGERPGTEAEFISRYRGTIDVLRRNPNVCGFCYTQLTDVEQEVNGLYTYDRRAKFDPEIIRSINQQSATIEDP